MRNFRRSGDRRTAADGGGGKGNSSSGADSGYSNASSGGGGGVSRSAVRHNQQPMYPSLSDLPSQEADPNVWNDDSAEIRRQRQQQQQQGFDGSGGGRHRHQLKQPPTLPASATAPIPPPTVTTAATSGSFAAASSSSQQPQGRNKVAVPSAFGSAGQRGSSSLGSGGVNGSRNSNNSSSRKPPPPAAASVNAGGGFSGRNAAAAAPYGGGRGTLPQHSPHPPQPLFGRPSKKTASLEDELPDVQTQKEQHDVLKAAGAATPTSLLDDDTDDDDSTGWPEPSPSSSSSRRGGDRAATTEAPPAAAAAAAAASRYPPAAGGYASQRQQQQHRGTTARVAAAASPSSSSAARMPPSSSPTGRRACGGGGYGAAGQSGPTATATAPAAVGAFTRGESDMKFPPAKEETAGSGGNSNRMSSSQIEDAKEKIRQLLSLCNGEDNINLETLSIRVTVCKTLQEQVQQFIQQFLQGGGYDESYLQELFQLNEMMVESIKLGENTRSGHQKPAAEESKVDTPRGGDGGTSPSTGTGPTPQHVALDVQALVDQMDVFSLICMLRAQQQERRLEAAWAIMQFARDTSGRTVEESEQIRREICSLGGMQSLLTLFRARGGTKEVKIVVALAVAYILPVYIAARAVPLDTALEIMVCLHFLSEARTITPNGHIVPREECFKASAQGLFHIWIATLHPLLEDSDRTTSDTPEEGVSEDAMVPLTRTVSLAGKSRNSRTAGGGMFDQRREAIELQELLEMTVSLIIYIADAEANEGVQGDNELDSWRYQLVMQICAVEVARPIAVREHILKIIVNWIVSADPEKIEPATSALRHLTSIKDKYMAGWIHSQMVNQGALEGIVKLTQSRNRGISHDVELNVAEVLSLLCVAPHTRAAVVDAKGIALLIQFICDYKQSPSMQGALYAGSALIHLAAGAITRASVFGDEEVEDKGDDVVRYVCGHCFGCYCSLDACPSKLNLFLLYIMSGILSRVGQWLLSLIWPCRGLVSCERLQSKP